MPLVSRPKQLSIVLDPARLSQRVRRADRPVCSPAACDGGGRAEDECMLLLPKWRSGRMIHPPGHLHYIVK
eukprot:1087577-Prymnesium_polylepis.1